MSKLSKVCVSPQSDRVYSFDKDIGNMELTIKILLDNIGFAKNIVSV